MRHQAMKIGVLCTIVLLTVTACTDEEKLQFFFGFHLWALLAGFVQAVFPGTVST